MTVSTERGLAVCCLAALLLSCAAIGLRFALEALFGPIGHPLVTLVCMAAALAAWWGGLRAGVATTALSMAGYVCFFIEPGGSLLVWSGDDMLLIVAAVLCALLGSWLSENLHAARRGMATAAAEQARLREEAVVWRARYEVAVKASRSIVYDSDRASGQVLYSGDCEGILGYSAAELAGDIGRWIALIHPEDRAIFERELAAELRYQSINRVLADMNGVPVEAHLGRTVDEVLPDVVDKVRPWFRQVMDTGEPILERLLEGRTHRLPGEQRAWVESWVPIPDAEGRPAAVGVIVREITGQRAAEALLRQSEERLRLFVQHAPAAIAMFDGQMRYLAASERWIGDYGLAGQSLLGRSHYEVFADLPARWREVHARALAGEVVRNEDDHFARADGTEQWLRWEARPWRDAAGAVGGILIFTEDITARRRAEQALRSREAEYRSLFESAATGNAEAEPGTSRFVRVNRRYCRMLGYTEAELLGGMTALQVTHPDDRAANAMLIGTLLEGEERSFEMEKRYCRKDGSVVWGHVSVALVPGGVDGQARLLASVVDITARKAAEEQYRATFEQAAVGVAHVATDGRWVRVNRQLSQLLGYSVDELLAGSFQGVTHPDDLTLDLAHMRTLLAGEADTYGMDKRYLRKDGSAVWVHLTVSLVRTPAGLPDYFISVVEDISVRKAYEEQLRQADRRKDEFLATLAHELRNPLAPLRSGLQLLKLAPGDAAAVQRLRGMMDRQLSHMVHLIDDLMDVSRISRGKITLQLEPVDLAAALRDAVETASPQIQAKSHQLALDLPPEPVVVRGDRTRLAQVFANLLTNAAKYTDPGGRIRMVAERAAGGVAVSVQDTGIGIPPESQDRVFELFAQIDRSLEKAQGGLGIGLYIVRQLVEMHGGRVDVHSAGLGAGSTFTVVLPTAADADGAGAPGG